jgi:hypothetical protein
LAEINSEIKKIAVIGLDQWGYNKYIARALESHGHTVQFIDYYKLRYKYPGMLHKTGNFLTKNLFGYNFKRAHLDIVMERFLENMEHQDVIFVIKGDELSAKILSRLKSKTDRLIAFFNDSVKRYPRMKKIADYFDEVYSFELEDVYNYGYHFLSNYIYFDPKEFSEVKNRFNIFNISSLNQRKNYVQRFASYFEDVNQNHKIIVLGDRPVVDNGTCIEYIEEPIPLNEVLRDYVAKSRVLLDIQRAGQDGLSFRIFESLGLGKKLITTNRAVTKYDFYDPINICVVDPKRIEIPESFFLTDYNPVDKKIVANYKIENWVKFLIQ